MQKENRYQPGKGEGILELIYYYYDFEMEKLRDV